MSNDNPAVGGLPEVHLPDGVQHPATPAAPAAQHVDAAQQFTGPQHAGAAPQQLAAPQHADGAPQSPHPSAPQHAGGLHQAAAPQHAGSALEAPHQGMQGVQHAAHTAQHAGPTGAVHASPVHSGQSGMDQIVHGHDATAHAIDHAATGPGAPSHLAPAQHVPNSLEAPHPTGVDHVAGAQNTAGSHAGMSAGKGPISKLRYLRHARPRMHMLIVGGGTAAIVTVGALAVAKAQSDDSPKPTRTATATIAVVTTDLGAPVVTTAAKVTVPAAPATTAPVVTTAATTAPVTEAPTTLPALTSGAGSYAVTVGNIAINGGGFSTSVPGDTQTWVFTGPCDGVGDCSISAAGGEVALSTGAAASIFAGPGSQINLIPAGSGSYSSTFDIPIQACGTATGNIVITVGGGAVTGDYSVNFSSGGSCPLAMLTATFNGTLS